MFLVEKASLSSHFRSIKKKSSQVPKNYLLAARSFDEKVILHLKTLDPPTNSSKISLFSLSNAVSFLSIVHSEAEQQISSLKSDVDDYEVLYMDYSLKVLDMCNLISSAVHRLTDRRLLMNFILRLLHITDQLPPPEKLNKAKDALARCVTDLPESAPEKACRAKALIVELTELLGKLPRGKSDTGRDYNRRTFTALIILTVFVGSLLVTVLFGEFDFVKPQVPAEFLFADSVNGEWTRIFDLIKSEQNAVLELDDVSSQAKVVHNLMDSINGGDIVQLEAGVKALAKAAKKYSDGIDLLTNGVNGMFQTVMKTRNGRLVN